MKISLWIVLVSILGISFFNTTAYSDIESLRVPFLSKESDERQSILNIVYSVEWFGDLDVNSRIKNELIVALEERIESGYVSLHDLHRVYLYNLLGTYKDYYEYFRKDYTIKETAVHMVYKLRNDILRIKVFEIIKRDMNIPWIDFFSVISSKLK